VQGSAKRVGTRLVLSLNHILTDGIGGRNLLSELLEYLQSKPKHIAALPDLTVPHLPPTLESSVDVRPRLLHMLHVVFLELVAPHLPWFLRPRPPLPHWPNPPPVAPYTCAPRVALFQLPATLLPALKRTGQAHAVRTLHPLLHTIGLFALYHATDHAGPLRVKTWTPISQRSPEAGHPACTGNYVADHAQLCSLAPASSFWDLARKYANELVDPTARARARGEIGMLAYVPNPSQMPAPDKSGWEVFWERKLVAPEPYSASLMLSNLGVMEGEAEGVEEVVFGQMPSPIGPGLTLNVSSFRFGVVLRLVTLSFISCWPLATVR